MFDSIFNIIKLEIFLYDFVFKIFKKTKDEGILIDEFWIVGSLDYILIEFVENRIVI